MQRGDLLHRTAMPGGFGCPACTGGTPSTRRWASARASAVRLPCRGFGLVLALGCGEEVGYAHVDTGHRIGRGEWFGGHLVTGEDDVPLPALARDADRLDPAFDGPVLVHPNVPHALQADAGDRVVWGGVPAAAIPVLGELGACRTSSRHGTGDSPASH